MPTPKYSDVMVDLETLDTGNNAVVTSIGVVAFDAYGAPIAEGNYQSSELVLKIKPQQEVGRTISGDTVEWWMRQSPVAQQVLFGPDVRKIEPLQAWKHIIDFVHNHTVGVEKVRVWGNGATFDNVILESLFRDFRVEPPWRFFNNSCFRTMKNLAFVNKEEFLHEYGVAHSAADDAYKQAYNLQLIMRQLKEQHS